MLSSGLRRAGITLLLLVALITGCIALEIPAGRDGNATPPQGDQIQVPPGVNPAVLPLLQQFRTAPSYRLIPLRYSTGPGPWEAYSTWPYYHFEYRGDGYNIHTPYNTAAYESAKISYPNRDYDRYLYLVTLSNFGGNFWYFMLPTPPQVDWYLGLIADPAQNETYDAILSQLRPIRDRYQLDDNEYAELIARFVQRSIPNREQNIIERYPIETIGDLGGGRVDKSLLLAGLLSREGYAVSLIYFPNVNEMLVGIKGDPRTGIYDGYLAIDPSTETYFGMDVAKSARIIPDTQYFADFAAIPVSDGKGYTAGLEVRGIWDSWLLFATAEDPRNYVMNLNFITKNRDNRHLVFEYLSETGLFG